MNAVSNRPPTTVFDRYNRVAAYRGWLPIGIGPHSSARTLRVAADKIAWQNLEVARDLRVQASEMDYQAVKAEASR